MGKKEKKRIKKKSSQPRLMKDLRDARNFSTAPYETIRQRQPAYGTQLGNVGIGSDYCQAGLRLTIALLSVMMYRFSTLSTLYNIVHGVSRYG